jgi:hypothetical protein
VLPFPLVGDMVNRFSMIVFVETYKKKEFIHGAVGSPVNKISYVYP